MELPKFKYHPEPLVTGSIEESECICECCGKATGFIYTGLPYSEEDLEDSICPWCIANGDAHEKFDAEFTDYDAVGDYGSWAEVSSEIKREIAFRTPGFSGWQEHKWWTHCNDAAAFLGFSGVKEIKEFGPQLIEELKSETIKTYKISEEDWDNYLNALNADESPTAYIFKCNHCGKLGGYSDFD